MHWVCFHYEFEHDPTDPDEACNDLACPSRQMADVRPVVEKDARLAGTVAQLARDVEVPFLVLDTAPADLRAVNLASTTDPRVSVYVSTISDDGSFTYELEGPSEDDDQPYAGGGLVEGVTYAALREATAKHLRGERRSK